MRKALALDIGGVVYRSQPDAHFYRRWSEVTGCSKIGLLGERLWWGQHWLDGEVGKITADDCFAAIAALLGLAPETIREMGLDAFGTNPDERLAECVARVRRRGVTVFALTNNVQRAGALLTRPELARLFDAVVSSADVGLRKPDPAIYRHVEAQFGLGGDEIAFVDDVLVNVDAARELGWLGIHFRSTEQVIDEIEAAFHASCQ